MTKIAFVDAPAGIAGDMCLGALIDLGWPTARLQAVIEALGLPEVTFQVHDVKRNTLAAKKVDVLFEGELADQLQFEVERRRHAKARTLIDVTEILERARTLSPDAVDDAIAVFGALADAEGRVHGHEREQVHFHEVGAEDALVDILGTCLALRDLGVDELRVGPLPMGTGTVETAHGTLPLPAPAVAHLLEGHPVVATDATFEQVTPTGAALVRALGRGTHVPDGFRITAVGTGAGTYEGGRLPNVVRILLGEVEASAGRETVILLETNLDDATGQEVGRALERALAEGALDAWAAPVVMKKGRPGHVLSLLATPADAERLETLLFEETPTLGVRRRAVERRILTRRHEAVDTPWGNIRMKVRTTPSGEEATPEYEDCRASAEAHGVPLRLVSDAAKRSWAERS